MKIRKLTFILVIIGMAFSLLPFSWQAAKAAEEEKSITKVLTYQKPLDIYLGKGGVYTPSSAYSGKAVLSRVEAINTKNLSFTQRLLNIHLYDSTGKEFKKVYGLVYVYFNLNNNEDRKNWDKGKISIYHYNEAKKSWEECTTKLISDKSAPFGRVKCLITQEIGFGQFGLAVKR